MSDSITIRLGVEGFRVTWWEETEPEEAEAEVGEAGEGEPRLGLLGVACGVGVAAPPVRVRGVRSDAC